MVSSDKIALISPFPLPNEDSVRFSALGWYTKSLINTFDAELRDKVIVIAQKEGLSKKDIVDGLPIFYTWSYDRPWFFLQIFIYLIGHKIKKVHLQHEVYVFGRKQYVYPYLSILLILLLRIFGINVVTTIHGVVPIKDLNKNFAESNSVRAPLSLIRFGIKFMYKMTAILSNLVVVHNEKLKKFLVIDYGVREGKIKVISLPLYKYDNKNTVAKSLIKIPKDKKVILFFGFLAPYKGLDKVVESCSKMDLEKLDALMLIVGSSPKRYNGDARYSEWLNVLKNNSSKISENIVWIHEYVPDFEIKSYFDRAQVVIIPYTECISASGSLSLAISNNNCVVVSRAFEDVVDENLVYGESSEDLASALNKFFNDLKYQEMIQESVRKQKADWSDEVISRKTKRVYFELTER